MGVLISTQAHDGFREASHRKTVPSEGGAQSVMKKGLVELDDSRQSKRSIMFVTAMQDIPQTNQPTCPINAPQCRTEEPHFISDYPPPLFPFFPSLIPSNFLLNASLTLLCPAHSQLILFMRQAAMTMNPTARNDGLFFSVRPIFPRRLSARRKRGDEGLGVTLISERRLRSIWLLCARVQLAESGRINYQ